MSNFETLVKALRVASPIKDLSLTCTGRAGCGNQIARLKYKNDHLVIKVMLRDDFKGDERKLYLAAIRDEETHPWVAVHKNDSITLHDLDLELGIKPENHLTASMASGSLILTAMEHVGWKKLYLRQWSAQNGGIGLELVGVSQTDEVFEVSINYYVKPQMESLQESFMRAIATKEKEEAAQAEEA